MFEPNDILVCPIPLVRAVACHFGDIPERLRFGVPEVPWQELADFHEAARHEPDGPQVRANYDAFIAETLAQYRVVDSFLRVSPWLSGVRIQPYETSGALHEDLRRGELSFFTGADLPADHPLSASSPVSIDGFVLNWNHVFRVVHDAMGHGLAASGFGDIGEFRAWQAHTQLYTDEALPALGVETLMQAAAFHHGSNRHIVRRVRPYPDQKAYRPPEEFCQRPTLRHG